MLTDLDSARVGDVVAFDWEGDGDYEHVGIITKRDNNISNIRNWSIVSSLGVVEIFEYGAKLTRLGVFGSRNSGGDFNRWNPAFDNWKFNIFTYKTTKQIFRR